MSKTKKPQAATSWNLPEDWRRQEVSRNVQAKGEVLIEVSLSCGHRMVFGAHGDITLRASVISRHYDACPTWERKIHAAADLREWTESVKAGEDA
jgi:hypothetical protein